jgi:GTPase SAR1 family protein
MDITMIGLQNAGKTSLLRALAISYPYQTFHSSLKIPRLIPGYEQGGEFTIEYVFPCAILHAISWQAPPQSSSTSAATDIY